MGRRCGSIWSEGTAGVTRDSPLTLTLSPLTVGRGDWASQERSMCALAVHSPLSPSGRGLGRGAALALAAPSRRRRHTRGANGLLPWIRRAAQGDRFPQSLAQHGPGLLDPLSGVALGDLQPFRDRVVVELLEEAELGGVAEHVR